MHPYIDRIETLELREKWGVIVGCTKRAFINEVSEDWEDFESAAYAILDEGGLPEIGSYLDDDRCNHLHLVDRIVRMVDKNAAQVDLVYEKFNDRGQSLLQGWATITNRNVAGKMQASVAQKATNLYRDGGEGSPEPITLTHTYPDTDPDYAGRTIEQTGTVDVYQPQRTFTVEGIKLIQNPWDKADDLIGSVNSSTWLGQKKHTWMCTEVTWEYRDEGNYFMTFTFQHNPDTWNPTAVFIDDRTGRPPEDLVEDEGYKYIRYHKEVNFTKALGFYVIGPAQ